MQDAPVLVLGIDSDLRNPSITDLLTKVLRDTEYLNPDQIEETREIIPDELKDQVNGNL